MIQQYLKDILETQLPSLDWSVSHRHGDENKATVYYEGGGQPGLYDVPNRYPNYMVYLSSSDWEYVEYAAHMVLGILHKRTGDIITVEFKQDGDVIDSKTFKLFWIEAQGEPNDLGVDAQQIRAFSVNFRVTLTEMKEENRYAT